MKPNPATERLLEDWLQDEASVTVPHALHASVIDAVRTRRQRPAWLVSARGGTIGSAAPVGWLPTPRVRFVILVAVLTMALLGVAMLIGATRPALAPQELRSTWVAIDPTGAIARGSLRVELVVDATRVSTVSHSASGTIEWFVSAPVPAPAGELAVVTTKPAGGCRIGDLGRYRYALDSAAVTPGTDGTFLRLTVVADACTARRATFERSWVHPLDAPSN